MKKLLMVTLIVVSLFTITGCDKKENKLSDSVKFKNEYEQLNGKISSNGSEYRTINIDNDNPYVYVSAEKAVEMIENNETFYIYIGDKQCPWCRSVLEKCIEVARLNNIKKIYYINIWDDDHNEIFRDKYKLDEKNIPVLVSKGTEAYYKMLSLFDELLIDYTLTNDAGEKIKVGEKRIMAPNFVYIKNGKAVKLVSGISEKQISSGMKLTDEILKDEEKIFSDFFS